MNLSILVTNPILDRGIIKDPNAKQKRSLSIIIVLGFLLFFFYQLELRWQQAIHGAYGYWLTIGFCILMILLSLYFAYEVLFKINYDNEVTVSEIKIIKVFPAKKDESFNLQIKLASGRYKNLRFSTERDTNRTVDKILLENSTVEVIYKKRRH